MIYSLFAMYSSLFTSEVVTSLKGVKGASAVAPRTLALARSAQDLAAAAGTSCHYYMYAFLIWRFFSTPEINDATDTHQVCVVRTFLSCTSIAVFSN